MRLRRRTYALLNLGRDDSPLSTNPVDWRILTRLKRSLPRRNWVVFFVEINEGDDNNERRLIRQRFPNARLVDRASLNGPQVREPILLSPDLSNKVADVVVRWAPKSSVAHWSPTRSVMQVILTTGEVLQSAHYPAGANGQGSRPAWAREPLQVSWDNTHQLDRSMEAAQVYLGRNVTSMKDVNAYDVRTYPEPAGARTVVHERTDWGRVHPAEGYRADFHRMSSVDISLDSHNILRMRGTYTERG